MKPDGQRMEKTQLGLGLDNHQTVRLGNPAGDLRQKLGAGNSYGYHEPGLGTHIAPELNSNLACGPEKAHRSRYIQERFIDRYLLYQRRKRATDFEDDLGKPGVVVVAAIDDDELRTQSASTPEGHCGAHSECPRLVARGQHDAAPDGNRQAS